MLLQSAKVGAFWVSITLLWSITEAVTDITLPYRLKYFTSCDTSAPNAFQFNLNANYLYVSYFIRVRYPGVVTTGLCTADAMKLLDNTGAVGLFFVEAHLEKLKIDYTDGAPAFKTASG